MSTYAETRLKTCTDNYALSLADVKSAQVREQDAISALAAAQEEADRAADSYASDPTKKTAASALSAREAVVLAQAKLEACGRTRQAAVNAANTAKAALDDASSEAAAEERAARIASLLPIASIERFYEEAAGPYERIVVLERELEEELRRVAEAFDRANAASEELTAIGQPTLPLARGHMATAALAVLFQYDPDLKRQFCDSGMMIAQYNSEAASEGSSFQYLQRIFGPCPMQRLRGCGRNTNYCLADVEAWWSCLVSHRTAREIDADILQLPYVNPKPRWQQIDSHSVQPPQPLSHPPPSRRFIGPT